MYYEERVIDGRLCCRTTPDGEWITLSAENLTERLMRFYHADGTFTIMHSPQAVVSLRIAAAKALESDHA